MASPPQSPPLQHGASCMTGGILCGNALGNVYNFGDCMDMDTKPGKVIGKGHVYTTHGNPEDLKPYMVLKHEVTNCLTTSSGSLETHTHLLKVRFNF
jgi:hypothetical protein